jgi:hypothetical protein
VRRRGASTTPELPLPKRPYRDSIIFYAILAALIVVVTYLTAGDLVRGLVFAAGFFVIATTWSWWRFRTRLAEERKR